MERFQADVKCEKIIRWFLKEYPDWVEGKKLISWTKRLGIDLNRNSSLDENSLFHLFILAILWNSFPTYRSKKGEKVFMKIKNTYTLTNFRAALTQENIQNKLTKIAEREIKNIGILNILNFIANGEVGDISVWTRIKNILTSKNVGERNSDVARLKSLYNLFNPAGKRSYMGKAYLTKKTFLIFRELKIQFRDSGKFQYHPSICCVPDTHVQQALIELNLIHKMENQLEGYLKVSEIVANYFCKYPYELYDLPLFFANKEGFLNKIPKFESMKSEKTKPKNAGVCPICGSKLVWR